MLIELFGWVASVCLAICGVPLAWDCYKKKSSQHVDLAFVLLWGFGEVGLFVYTLCLEQRLIALMPLLFNYLANLLAIGVILYYYRRKGQPEEIKDDK